MNRITEKIATGTVGELLVTLKLLQYGVQAAPPLKDSGNDLIAIFRRTILAIQVKTITKNRFNNSGLPELYDLVAYVYLVVEEGEFNFEKTKIFLQHREEIFQKTYSVENLEGYELSRDRVNEFFGINPYKNEIEFISDDEEEEDDDEPRVAVRERAAVEVTRPSKN